MYVQARGVNLSCVRSCVVIAEERPRLALTQPFSKLFKDLGLSPRAVSTAFGARVNLAICLQVGAKNVLHQHCIMQEQGLILISVSFYQGTAGPDPSTVYVDMISLRHDRYVWDESGGDMKTVFYMHAVWHCPYFSVIEWGWWREELLRVCCWWSLGL